MQANWELLLGPFGGLVLCFVCLVVLWRKLQARDLELAKEHEARLVDAKQYAEALLRVAEGTHQAIDRLSDLQAPNNRKILGTNQRM